MPFAGRPRLTPAADACRRLLLHLCYYLQEVGIDISDDTANSTIIMPSVMRAYITPNLFFIGFIPGLFSMLFGTALAGRGIYKRETARLFKELEV